MDISDAVREAQDYTWQALKYGFRPGMGQLIPDRMFWARDDGEDSQASLSGCEPAPTGTRH
jgi:hydroxymethylpyrimidine/phosphomethylpyrimidine kinase